MTRKKNLYSWKNVSKYINPNYINILQEYGKWETDVERYQSKKQNQQKIKEQKHPSRTAHEHNNIRTQRSKRSDQIRVQCQ